MTYGKENDTELKFGLWKNNRIKLNWKKIGLFGAFIVLSGVISFFILKKFTPYFAEWQQYGYLGLFLCALVANVTIVVPAVFMSFIVPFAVSLAGQTNILLVAVVYAAGATLGESLGYILGRWGKRIIIDRNGNFYQKAEKWLEKYGWWAIIALSLQPILPFDIVGIVAGTLKYPFFKFLIFCFLGRVPKYLIVITIGSGIWEFVTGLFN